MAAIARHILLASVGLLACVLLGRRAAIPAHLLAHPAVFVENLLSPQAGAELLAIAKNLGPYPTNTEDTTFYVPLREHIGEAEPIDAHNRCAHPYLVPNANRTLCVLPGRIDIGRHFVVTGGVDGLKERHATMVARLLSFGHYIFNVSAFPAIAQLFAEPKFRAVAVNTCPAEKQVLDPFQFSIIVQVPGQTVAAHLDGVYFWGADRFSFPQWLLAVMKFSGLFEAQFIPQIQVVAYFHEWRDARGGDFVFWDSPSPSPQRVAPTPLAGSAVDGSKVVHAATVYQPHAPPLILDKSRKNRLVHVGHDVWNVTSDGRVVRSYATDDLRWTVVYRARCFASETERARFAAQKANDTMTLEHVLAVLEADLVARGRYTAQSFHALAPMALAFALLAEYVRYPLPPTALVPFNWCVALPDVFADWC